MLQFDEKNTFLLSDFFYLDVHGLQVKDPWLYMLLDKL